VRLPGGVLGADASRLLADAATELGDGRLELTSRGNVQLRGLAAGSAAALRPSVPSSRSTWPPGGAGRRGVVR
jgi:precorrin-3B synthase